MSVRHGVFTVLTFAGIALSANVAPARASWPEDSLHHVDVGIETSRGTKTSLAATEGRVRIATMFYASCPMACPLIIDTLRSIDRALTAEQRDELRVLMVTLDPDCDTPAALRELAAGRRIDEARWTLGRASSADTRKLAGALGIQYRKLDDGNFNHSSMLVLIDANGRVLARSTVMGVPDPAFVAAVRRATSRA